MGTNWRPADPLTGRRNRNGSISPLLISRTHMMRSKVASPPTQITVPAQQNALAQRCYDVPGMPLRLWHFKVAAPNPQKDSCIRTHTTRHMMRRRRQTSISSPGGNLPMLLSGRRRGLLPPCLVVAVVVVLSAASVPRADAYKNYTVGDDKGWYDGLTLPGVDYQQWADGYNFSLGDFLIFNTDKNHSVVQTRNQTLYKSCDYNDSGPDDTIEWSAAAPEFSKDAATVAVPLLKEGPTYFFSGNYDGEQCENGQRFAITVAHGQGLPPDLRQPAAEAPAPAAGPGAGADAAPVLDFSHPKNVSTPDTTAPDDEPSSSTSGSSRTLAGLGPDLVMAMLVTVLFAVQVV